MRKHLFILSAIILAVQSAYALRIAVWDPQSLSRETRFRLDLKALDTAAAWLRDAGIETDRLTADQVNDASVFSAKYYDAFMLIGEAFPRANIPAYKRFSDEGGILVSLGAKLPFIIAIEPEKDGGWALSPKEPKFAWQTGDILAHFNMKYVYKPEMHDKGVEHTMMPLLKRYLPDAADIKGTLRGWWIIPYRNNDGECAYYPLIRSRRIDGADVTPQMFIARTGRKTALFSLNEWYADGSNPSVWPYAKETVVAFARIAGDLRSGTLTLDDSMRVPVEEKIPPLPPFCHRFAQKSVDPEGALPLIRIGVFDGSGREFSDMVPAGAVRDYDGTSFPRGLEPGASVRITLPPPAGRSFLRVRAGANMGGAGLSLTVGGVTVLSEEYTILDPGGPGNFTTILPDTMLELTRISFLPDWKAGDMLVVANPGRAPVYFDALQIERRTGEAPPMIIGLGAGFSSTLPGTKTALTAEYGRRLTTMRCTTRGQFAGPPGDGKRWDTLDALMDRYFGICPRIDMLLEGTPQWAAISPERYDEAKKAGRPHACAPDAQRYREIVEHLVNKYGDRIEAYEIWNEADIQQFYRGTPAEYAAFFKEIVPVIKRLDPTAKILTSGMAGFHESFVSALALSGALALADLIAFHPYTGKNAGWDLSFGLIEGDLYSRGYSKEIYCNESGFVWKNAEWFQPPPQFTPEVQRKLINTAVARLLSCGLAKLNVFHAGGDDHPYGLVDDKGESRPAYKVMEDYFALGGPTARRLDAAMAPLDSTPLRGVYRAAAYYDDGRIVIVVNPAEMDAASRTVVLRCPVKDGVTAMTAAARVDQTEQQIPATVHAGASPWVELQYEIKNRTVFTLSPVQ
ncbi:MAG: hypothetical protein HZC28_03605 [Spirochaetes bacterium]|nr:hypothetical protein [Spirochaetota bacterium]